MSDYVLELSDLDQVGGEPGFFWLRDFRQLAETNLTEEIVGTELDLSFNQQLNLALSIPQLRQIYGRDIVRDPESGNITASRTFMFLRDFDMYVDCVRTRFVLVLEAVPLNLCSLPYIGITSKTKLNCWRSRETFLCDSLSTMDRN
jgi:hypothetical protein